MSRRMVLHATSVPGLYNVRIDSRMFYDLTRGQVFDVMRREGLDPGRVITWPSEAPTGIVYRFDSESDA